MAKGGMRLGGLAVVMVLGLAACSSDQARTPAPGPEAVARNPYPVPPPPPPIDQCGAGELAWLVGRPRTEIPVPVQVTTRRVVCTTCPRDEADLPGRLTILYDRDTDLVQSVQCG